LATEKDILNDVLLAEESALGEFEERWKVASRNAEIYGLDHWESKDKNRIIAQNRIPYVFDRISHAMNTLLGTQRDTRFDIRFYGRNREDELKAEILNAQWKYYSDVCDYIHVESDVFQDSAVGGYGVFGVDVDRKSDYRGNLKVKRIPFDQLIWDKSFRQYDLSDCYWMDELCFYRKDELKKYNPDKADFIDLIGTEGNWIPKNKNLQLSRWYKPDKELIGVHKFYERDWQRKYVIWQKGKGLPEEMPYDSEEDASAEIQRRNQTMLGEAGQMMMQAGMSLPEFEVLPIEVPIVKKSEVVINGVLKEPEIFDMGSFPFSVCFAYFHDGNYWSVIDRLKDPQKFINRMYAQIDHWIGTMSKGLLWVDPHTPDNEVNLIKETFGKTGGVIQTKYMPQLIESKGPAPQLFSVLDRVEAGVEDQMGGANFAGLKQTASESGRAVLARQAQAGLDHFIPLDNLRRTKQNLGEKIAYLLTKEMTEPRTYRIIGDTLSVKAMQNQGILQPSIRPNVGYMNVNSDESNTVRDIEVDVIVDEAQHSITKNQSTLSSLVDLAKSNMLPGPMPPELIAELSDLPESMKQVMVQHYQALAQQPKEAPMKISGSYKDLPPDVKMQILTEMGFQVSPGGVAIKEVIDKPHLTQKEKSGNTEG